MIIVTGMPRCGTSLLMQTIERLGHSVYGAKFPPNRMSEHNPRGFWEDRDALTGELDRLNGRIAVKVMVRKLIERVPPELLTPEVKLIFCQRSPLDAARSMMRCGYGNSTLERTRANVVRWNQRFLEACEPGGKFAAVPVLNVLFQDMLDDKAASVEAIHLFIGGFPEIDRDRAINNILDPDAEP